LKIAKKHYYKIMDQYDNLASVYDKLFPPAGTASDWLWAMASKAAAAEGRQSRPRVLDLGAATGSDCLALARRGAEATGLDPSAAMLGRARDKAEEAGVDVEFREGGMLDAGRLFAPGAFDLVLCLGNTLPHLGGPTELARFLAEARKLLSRKASLVLQLLNYDLVLGKLAQNAFAFPEIREGGLVFRRRYEAGPEGKLRFITELEAPGRQSLVGEAELCPFRPAELDRALAMAGFGETEKRSGWTSPSFAPERDLYLIVTAHKSPRD
jgi:SAM-dependent methyltransferase